MIVHNALLSGHPGGGGAGGVTPRRYAGMAQDLPTLFVNFKPGICWGDWIAFALS